MWYSILLTDRNKEMPLFIKGCSIYEHNEEFEVEYSNYVNLYTQRKWDAIFRAFENYRYNSTLTFSKEYLLNTYILVQKGFLAVQEDNQVRILINETDENVYIDKYFERDYKKLFLKFKNIILSLYASSKDIIYTDNAGKNSFLQFEKPKFRALSERREYINKLLSEIDV